MQLIIRTTLFLTLLQHLTLALGDTACTDSNASNYDPETSKEGCSAAAIARDDTGCVQDYCTNGGTPASLQTCFCLALNEGNCGSTTEERREVDHSKQKREDFTCSSSEKCYINPEDGGLFCLDEDTGDYVGESGDSGNRDTGAYTPASGETSTTSASKTASTDPSSESETSTTTSSKTSSKSTSATATATGTSASAIVASTTTQTGGMARVTAEAIMGVLGLAVGFAL